jgi:antitoxin component YwqK of YwqJK toxin-antitoxin module
MRSPWLTALLLAGLLPLTAFPSLRGNHLDRAGKPHGKWIEYLTADESVTETDSVMAYYLTVHFKHGEMVGEAQERYRTGELFYAGPLLSLDPPRWGSGLFTFYNKDKSIQKTLTLQDGVPNGPAAFYEHGVCIGKGSFENRQKNGDWVEYKDGLESHGAYVYDRKQGPWTVSKNGRVVAQGEFLDDERAGRWDFYDDNGKTRASGTFDNGHRVGDWTQWQPDGSYCAGTYENDYQEGLWTYYSPSGQLMFQGNFHLGQRDGEWTIYTKFGAPGRIVTYRNGIAVKDRPADMSADEVGPSSQPKK